MIALALATLAVIVTAWFYEAGPLRPRDGAGGPGDAVSGVRQNGDNLRLSGK